MSDFYANILESGEVEIYVKDLKPSSVENLGTPLWIESHHRLQKLSQQSTFEAGQMREENVKDSLISYGKVPVLIHEAICIQIWREKIFSKLIKLNHQPQHTFIAYVILFHEMTAVTILQNIMYHKDSLEGVGDALVDLIDYCAAEIVRLLSENHSQPEDSTDGSLPLEELKASCKTIGFNIGLTAICILRYLIEFIDELPLSAISRLYKTHDAPVLLSTLIQMAPWKRINPNTNITQVFEDRTWKNAEKVPGISKYEGQCWIALRFLLLDANIKFQYEINDFRRQHILKVQKYLNDMVVDQIPPLLELRRFLAQLSISTPQSSNKTPLIMETITEIKGKILKDCLKKWKSITKKQMELVFCANREVVMEIARRLGETYDLDHLEKLLPEGPVCSNCGDAAAKRCSKCKNEWYCGRECQVKRWPRHKDLCKMMSEQEG